VGGGVGIKEIKVRKMIDGLHIFIENRTKKPLAIVLSGTGRGLRGRHSESNLTSVQYKPIWNCHNDSPLYNEYILIKKFTKKIFLTNSYVI
jgi:hypothetical protein